MFVFESVPPSADDVLFLADAENLCANCGHHRALHGGVGSCVAKRFARVHGSTLVDVRCDCCVFVERDSRVAA